MANGGLLAGIMNPAQVDVLGSMDAGRERQATRKAGDLLAESIGGKVGELARLSPDKAMAYAKATNTPIDDMGRVKNLMGWNIMGAKLFQAGQGDEAANVLERAAAQIQEQTGQVPEALLKVVSDWRTNGAGGEIVKNFTNAGLSLDPSSQGESFSLGEGQVRYDSKGNPIARNIGAGGGIDKDFLKEERQAASATTKALRKRGSVISSSIGKIESLIPQIKEGSRAAAGGAIMSLARLISPGVVTDADFQAMSGAADPVATLMARLTEKGDSGKPLLEALQAAYDPTNPDLIDADAILNIARSVVGAEVPSILQEYKESDSRARRSGMNKRQYNTIFGDSESITGLSRYTSQSGKYQVEEI